MKQILAKEEILCYLAESNFERFFSFSVKEDVRLYFADKGYDILKEGVNSDGLLYAHFILFAASDGIYHERNTDASAYLGVSYRHLTQVLGEFTQYGYLKRTQGGYYITDEQALKQLANELNAE